MLIQSIARQRARPSTRVIARLMGPFAGVPILGHAIDDGLQQKSQRKLAQCMKAGTTAKTQPKQSIAFSWPPSRSDQRLGNRSLWPKVIRELSRSGALRKMRLRLPVRIGPTERPKRTELRWEEWRK